MWSERRICDNSTHSQKKIVLMCIIRYRNDFLWTSVQMRKSESGTKNKQQNWKKSSKQANDLKELASKKERKNEQPHEKKDTVNQTLTDTQIIYIYTIEIRFWTRVKQAMRVFILLSDRAPYSILSWRTNLNYCLYTVLSVYSFESFRVWCSFAFLPLISAFSLFLFFSSIFSLFIC